MTVPTEIELASLNFSRFLVDAREISGLTSTHQTYTMVEGVLRAFRRRLSVRDAVAFAGVLPPLLRAVFVADWDVDEPTLPFGDRAVMTAEAQSLRPDHNFAPDTAIRDVATALRRHVDEAALDRVLARLPRGATDFWRV
jgi:uncharacterized protein (DUF2267 family)